LMGSDSSEVFGQVTNIGNNFSVSIFTDTIEEADRLFAGLSEGGQVTMPLAKTFWGAYYGSWTDKFGVNWMVNVDLNQE
jgi:PhnB protein